LYGEVIPLAKPEFWKTKKRYYDLNSYWRNLFGCRIHKLRIDAGFTCPNRDGTVGVGGCTYCNNESFRSRSASRSKSISSQVREGIESHAPQPNPLQAPDDASDVRAEREAVTIENPLDRDYPPGR
jgi:hypothetical protein